VKSINAKIIEFIGLDNQLFSAVDDVGFHRLVEQEGAIFQILPFRSYTVLLKSTSMSYLLWASLL
jgi:hypothetical protein